MNVEKHVIDLMVVCFPTLFICWTHNPQWDGIWRWALGRLNRDEVMRMGPIQWLCPYKRREIWKRRCSQRKGRWSEDSEGERCMETEGWRDALRIVGTSKVASKLPGQRHETVSSLAPSGEQCPMNMLISDFSRPECETICCCFTKLPGLSYWAAANRTN